MPRPRQRPARPKPPAVQATLPQLGILQNFSGDGTLPALRLAARSHLDWVLLTSPHDLPALFGALAGGHPKLLYRFDNPSPSFVRQVVQTYGHQIAAYGICNEPRPTDGAAPLVAARLRVLAESIRWLQPDALIVGPDLQAGIIATAWGQQLLREIAGWETGLLSACSVHVIPTHAAEADILAQIRALPATLRGLGLGMPIWITEFGSGGTPDQQAGFFSRVVPAIGAAGYEVAIASMLIRDPHADAYATFGLIDSDGTPQAGWATLDGLATRGKGAG